MKTVTHQKGSDDTSDDTFYGMEPENRVSSPTSIQQFLQNALLHSPRLMIMASLASLFICAAYAGLGYWWVLSHDVSQAAEPFGLLGVQEQASSSRKTPMPDLTNLHLLENQSARPTAEHGGVSTPPEPKEKDSGASQPGILVAMSPPTQAITVESIKQDLKSPSGRPDPFAPLLEPDSGLPTQPDTGKKPEKRDVLIDLQYTGFIGDTHSKDKVAIIKVSDPMAGGTKTLIKKVGDSFLVEGERAVLKTVSKNGLEVNLSGQTRWLELHPYVEMTGNAAGSGSSNGANAGASGSAGSTAAGGASTTGDANAASDGGGATSGSAGTHGGAHSSGAGGAAGSTGGLSLQEQ